jgi:beta-phosphoglucomutase
MIRASPVRAVIFDFDGVLADTEALHCAAFQAVARSDGTDLSQADYFTQFLGLPDRACLAALYARAGRRLGAAEIDALVTRKRAQFAALSQAATLYDGVPELLRRLHARFALAVASGAFRDEIGAILDRAGVRALFAALVGAEDVTAGKPAPDPFLCALRELNTRAGLDLTAAECVVIEDSPLGIAGARAAGMRCIGVTTHHPAAALPADLVIAHVSELRLEDLPL